LSQQHGRGPTPPGGAPVRAKAVAGPLQPSAPQPLLHEPAMKPLKSDKSTRKSAQAALYQGMTSVVPNTHQNESGALAPAATPPAVHSQLVKIEKPIYGGAFLARIEGKAVFVPLTLLGEQARVRVVESKPGYANAEVEEIVAPAPERIAPACPHFGACGGCHYQHAGYES